MKRSVGHLACIVCAREHEIELIDPGARKPEMMRSNIPCEASPFYVGFNRTDDETTQAVICCTGCVAKVPAT